MALGMGLCLKNINKIFIIIFGSVQIEKFGAGFKGNFGFREEVPLGILEFAFNPAIKKWKNSELGIYIK